MSICDKCEKEYSNKYNLLRHQQTVCIKIKNSTNQCDKCEKILSSKQRLISHLKTCKKNTNINQALKNDKVQNITTNNTTTTNTSTTNSNNLTQNTIIHNYGSILSLTKEDIKETFDKNYTLEDLFGSQKGLADFTTKNFLSGKDNPLYICTDKSRQKFIFTDENKKEKEDDNAFIIIKLMSRGFGKVDELYKEELKILKRKLRHFIEEDQSSNIQYTHEKLKQLDEAFKKIKNIEKDGDVYRKQLSKVLPSSIENRILYDTYLNEDEDSENDEVPEIVPSNQILYDTTALHIGPVTYGGLIMYKKHYLKTGKKIYHPKHQNNHEWMKQFDEYCENDE